MSDYLSEAELLGKPAGDGYLSEAELVGKPAGDGYLSEAELLGGGKAAGKWDPVGATADVGRLFYDGPVQIMGAIGSLAESFEKDPLAREDWKDRWQQEASTRSRERRAALSAEGTESGRLFPGTDFIQRKDIVDASASSGFTAVSIAPSIASQALRAVPVAGVPLSYGAGMLGAGMGAYRMDKNAFTRQLLEKANAEMEQAQGRPLTAEERDAYLDATNDIRSDHALWEAGPEAVGNAIGMFGLSKVVSGVAGKGLRQAVTGYLANLGGELSTETVTQTGQQRAEAALGMTDDAPRSFLSPGDMGKSFGEVAPTTTILSGVTGGSAAVAGKTYETAAKAYRATQPSETVLSGASADEVAASFAAEVDSELRGLVAPTYAQAQPPVETTGPTFSGALAEAPEQIRALVLDAGARHGVDPALLAAQLKAESNFDANAESPAGALGIAQFMPATAAEYGVDPLDPAQAIDGQARYMARMLERFGGDPAKALAAYNAGPGRVADGSWEGIPETRGYVDKVLADPGLSGQEPARAAETGEQPAETAAPVDQVIAQADTGLDMAIAEPDAPMDAPVAPGGLLALEEEAAAPEAAVAPEAAAAPESAPAAVPETDFGDMPEIVPEQAVAIAPTEAATEPLVEAAPEEQPDRPAPRLKNNHGAGLNTPEADAVPETPAAPRLGGITMEQVRTVQAADGVRLVHKETGEELLPGRTFATIREARDAFRQARSEEDKQGLSKDLRYSIAPDRSAEVSRDADGRLNLGEISQEQATAMRRQPGAIRLAPGSHDQATGRGSGIAHIVARHGQEIRRAGYNSAEHLVADVVENHNEIRKGGAGSLLLVKRNGADKVAVVRLTKDASGEFYNVETAYLSRPSERRALLWSAAQSRSATPGGQPAFARESVVPSDQTTPNALPSSNAPTVAPDGTDVNEQRQPEATAQETKPATSESALIVDQQPKQAVTGDATADKTGDRTADVKAELGAALGRRRAERLIERGTVNVIATQAEAEAMVASAEQGNVPTVKRSENGRIQGLYLNGQVHLVADGIEAGKAHGVLLHELGEHARQLGFAKDAEYREILASLEQRKDARGATGKAIRAAMARVPENTPEADYWSEVAAYLVEEHADVQTSLIQRLVNFVKKWLFKAGAVSAERFTPADLALFARAAVRAEAKGNTRATERAGGGFMASMAKALGVSAKELQREYDAVVARYKGTGQWLKAPNGERSNLNERQWALVRTPRFKAWFGNWEMAAQMKSAGTFIDQVAKGRRPGNITIGVVGGKEAGKIKQLTGINAKGRQFELVADDIAHALKGHGQREREKARGQVAITTEDLKLLPIVLGQPTAIVAGSMQSGRQSVRFEKKINGTLVVVEIVPSAGGSVQFKTAWKRPSGTADALPASHTSKTDPSPPRSYNETIQRLLEESKASPVVDANGEPLVVYHGTNAAIDSFAKELISSKHDYSFGFHFTSSPSEASVYADSVENAATKWNPKSQFTRPVREGAAVYPMFIIAKNPLVVETDMPTASMEADLNRAEIVRKVVESRRQGEPYDAVLIKTRGGENTNVIPFEPTQIKSATGNTGAFSPTNPDIRYSRSTPEQTQHETEAAEDHGAVAETFAKRRDINPTSRLIASAEYTLSKDPAGQRMVDAAGRQLEHRVQLENAILDGIEPGADAATYQQLHNSFVNTFKALRKQSLASYERVRDYLLAIDKSGRGFRLRHEAGFLVTTPDGTELGVVKTKEQAYALRRDHHADTYGKKGRQGHERVLIADYPIRKNGECPHFYTFLHNICNFLTGRCWVLTPFLEVGARAFGITFA